MAQVQGSGAGQGVRKKKKLPVGPDRRIAPPTRSVTKHVYRGISFYSSDGRSLGSQQQKNIILAAQKIPAKVWDRLVEAGTKVIVMKNKDNVIAPVFTEYLKAVGIPHEDLIRELRNTKGEKNISYTDAGRHPVAVVGWGSLPPNPNGTPRFDDQEVAGHILRHEIAHTVDFSFQVMKAMGAAYGNLERKNLRTAVRAHEVQQKVQNEPIDVTEPGRMDVSNLKAFRSTVPKNYTAGYGESTVRYDSTVHYPRQEVFAEALARYWNKEMIPPKMKGFLTTTSQLQT